MEPAPWDFYAEGGWLPPSQGGGFAPPPAATRS